MAAKGAVTVYVSDVEKPALGARDVGHDGLVGEPVTKRAAEPAEQLETGRWGRGQNDEIGLVDGLIDRRGRRVDRPVGEGRQRTAACRRPGRHRPACSGRLQRPGDRPADQPESEQRHPHRPSIAGWSPADSGPRTSSRVIDDMGRTLVIKGLTG